MLTTKKGDFYKKKKSYYMVLNKAHNLEMRSVLKYHEPDFGNFLYRH